jgi:S-DNA-T family DNA segregation ATPase FtsK/SpoIIIE
VTQATRVGELSFSDYLQRGIREGAMWALICVAAYLVLALASYSPQDPGWSHVGHGELVGNAGGRAGAWFSDVALYLFGFFAYLIPVMIAWSGYLVFRKPESEPETRLHKLALRWFGFFLTLAAGCAFASIHLAQIGAHLPNGTGGGLGMLIGERMILAFSPKGATLFLVGLFLAGFRLLTGISWPAVLEGLGGAVLTLFGWLGGGVLALWRLVPIGRGESDVDEPRLLEGADFEAVSEGGDIGVPFDPEILVDAPSDEAVEMPQKTKREAAPQQRAEKPTPAKRKRTKAKRGS